MLLPTIAKRWLSLSWLLLATGLVLLTSAGLHTRALLQATAPGALASSGEGRVAIRAHTLPTGSGMMKVLAPVEPAAGPAANDGMPWRMEALQAIGVELRRRQMAIEAREQELALREAAIALAEKRLAEDVAALENGRIELERRIGRIEQDSAARAAQLIKIYEAMKAKSAAAIFENMEPETLIPIVKGMRDAKAAAIIAELPPEKARMLTSELTSARETKPATR